MKRRYEFNKKDFILLLIIGSVVLLLNYSLNWYEVYKEHKGANSIISKYLTEITKEDFDNYVEENPNTLVYYGDTDNNNISSVENTLKNIVVKNNLKDNIIYINLKGESKTLINKDVYPPIIVYYENKEIKDFIGFVNSNMKEKDILRFIRKYEDIY